MDSAQNPGLCQETKKSVQISSQNYATIFVGGCCIYLSLHAYIQESRPTIPAEGELAGTQGHLKRMKWIPPHHLSGGAGILWRVHQLFGSVVTVCWSTPLKYCPHIWCGSNKDSSGFSHHHRRHPPVCSQTIHLRAKCPAGARTMWPDPNVYLLPQLCDQRSCGVGVPPWWCVHKVHTVQTVLHTPSSTH